MNNKTTAENIAEKVQGKTKQLSSRDMLYKGIHSQLTSPGFSKVASIVLPEHIKIDKFVHTALLTCKQSDNLLNCTTSSIAKSVLVAAQLGLSLDPLLGQAYLVPYKTTCQFIPGYKGLVSLAYRSNLVSNVITRSAYSNDKFEVSLGTENSISHKREFVEDRGNLLAFYSVVTFKDGSTSFDVMDVKDIDKVRSGIPYKSDIWNKHYEEMARKTVFRRHAKYLPLTPEIQSAVTLDELAESGVQDLDTVIDLPSDNFLTIEGE